MLCHSFTDEQRLGRACSSFSFVFVVLLVLVGRLLVSSRLVSLYCRRGEERKGETRQDKTRQTDASSALSCAHFETRDVGVVLAPCVRVTDCPRFAVKEHLLLCPLFAMSASNTKVIFLFFSFFVESSRVESVERVSPSLCCHLP